MTKGENKHYRRSHISENKFRQLLKCFALDLNAYETHQLTHISHRSCKVLHAKLRRHIVACFMASHAHAGIFELDESYFGARLIRGKRGRGAAGKHRSLGFPKEHGKFTSKL